MSLWSSLFSNWWENLDRPHRLLGQDFGLPIDPNMLLSEIFIEPRRNELMYYRPSQATRRSKRRYHPFAGSGGYARKNGGRGTSTVSADKDKFLITLDVQQFAPNEISVKVIDKNVVVEAKHEEKEDEHGWISRQFIRKYAIPEQCDVDRVESSLSSDGILTITAPRKEPPKSVNERQIKIQYTGQPAIESYAENSISTSPSTAMDVDSSTEERSKERNEQPQQQQQQQRQQGSQRGKKGASKSS